MNVDQALRQRKQEIRRLALAARDRLPALQRELMSAGMAERVLAMPEAAEARCWFVYVSHKSEAGTGALIRRLLDAGAVVCVPCVDAAARAMIVSRVLDPTDDLAPGCLGIPEPKPGRLRPVAPESIDMVIVPGLAFSPGGGRVGYGGGYYDRFLRACPALSVGLAFETQLFDRVPRDRSRDISVHRIVTERRIIDCSPCRGDYSWRR